MPANCYCADLMDEPFEILIPRSKIAPQGGYGQWLKHYWGFPKC